MYTSFRGIGRDKHGQVLLQDTLDLVRTLPSGLLIAVRQFSSSSDHRRCGVLQRTVWLAVGADLFPHLPTMDRNGRIDLEAESHAAAPEFEYRDLEQALEADNPADHNGSQSFSRENQHAKTSVLMTI